MILEGRDRSKHWWVWPTNQKSKQNSRWLSSASSLRAHSAWIHENSRHSNFQVLQPKTLVSPLNSCQNSFLPKFWQYSQTCLVFPGSYGHLSYSSLPFSLHGNHRPMVLTYLCGLSCSHPLAKLLYQWHCTFRESSHLRSDKSSSSIPACSILACSISPWGDGSPKGWAFPWFTFLEPSSSGWGGRKNKYPWTQLDS